MRKLILFCGIFLALAVAAMAQDEPARVEAFAGYSYVRATVDTTFLGGTGHQPEEGSNFNGGSGQLAFNLNKWLGAVADFGGYTTNSTTSVTGNTNAFSYMFGPRVFLSRTGRIRPYGQVLLGGARLANSFMSSGSENAFAMALGGGIDYSVSKHLAVRPIQAEYFLTKFSDGNNNRQNNVRLSAGVVFRFGK